MDAFDLRNRLVDDYRRYTRSFIAIRDARIGEFVDGILAAEGFWPEPLLQLNPTFRPGGTIDDLVEQGALHPECARIFRFGKSELDHHGNQLLQHRHQREAILEARKGRSYVLTTGTGSGKSLAYIVPIVDHVLRRGSGRGIQAIVVYPMNALANSQHEELGKFIDRGYGGSPRNTGAHVPDAIDRVGERIGLLGQQISGAVLEHRHSPAACPRCCAPSGVATGAGVGSAVSGARILRLPARAPGNAEAGVALAAYVPCIKGPCEFDREMSAGGPPLVPECHAHFARFRP